jgi:hypothetical protein
MIFRKMLALYSVNQLKPVIDYVSDMQSYEVDEGNTYSYYWSING